MPITHDALHELRQQLALWHLNVLMNYLLLGKPVKTLNNMNFYTQLCLQMATDLPVLSTPWDVEQR